MGCGASQSSSNSSLKATLDQSSPTSLLSNPIITGAASGVDSVYIEVDDKFGNGYPTINPIPIGSLQDYVQRSHRQSQSSEGAQEAQGA